VEVPPVLLGVLAVVPLVAREPEDALLQDRVAPVPERKAEAESLLDVAEAGQAVLAPAVGARARMVVREVLPRRAARAVVLSQRAELPLGDVRSRQLSAAGRIQAVIEPAEGLDPLPFRDHRRDRRPARVSPASTVEGEPAARGLGLFVELFG